MRGKELEAIILRAIVACLADRVLERLGHGAPPSASRRPCPTPDMHTRTGRVFGREEAALRAPDSDLRISRKTLITPFAADELARRRVRVVRT